MNQEDFPTAQLSYLMGMDDKVEELWNRDELGALFAHQLAAPVVVDLQLDAEVDETTTFADVLFGTSSDMTIVEAIKKFSKNQTNHQGEATLPKSVAGVLYMCSIAAALVRAQLRITTLVDDDLKAKMRWALKQSWLDDRSRELLKTAINGMA